MPTASIWAGRRILTIDQCGGDEEWREQAKSRHIQGPRIEQGGEDRGQAIEIGENLRWADLGEVINRGDGQAADIEPARGGDDRDDGGEEGWPGDFVFSGTSVEEKEHEEIDGGKGGAFIFGPGHEGGKKNGQNEIFGAFKLVPAKEGQDGAAVERGQREIGRSGGGEASRAGTVIKTAVTKSAIEGFRARRR